MDLMPHGTNLGTNAEDLRTKFELSRYTLSMQEYQICTHVHNYLRCKNHEEELYENADEQTLQRLL